jgi:hypothetical protein
MPERQHLLTPMAPAPSTEAEQAYTSTTPVEPEQHWLERFWGTVRRYPIPIGTVALMVASLVLWLVGQSALANWALLAVVFLGGIPLLWETMQQVFRKELALM